MILAHAQLRELGAATRTFRGVRHALLWYRDQLAKRLSLARRYEFGAIPRSAEAREQTNATFAAVAACLTGPREPLIWLVAWYEHTEGDGTWLAQQAGLTRWAFARRCRKTEKAVRWKMEDAGLLEVE